MAVRIPSKKKNSPSSIKLPGLWVIFPALFFLLLFLFVLRTAGGRLVADDDFVHVEWAVVLAGQSHDCERTDAAVLLYKESRVKYLLISSIPLIKSNYMGQYIIPDMVKLGVPRKNIFEFKHVANSTIEEAMYVIGQFRLLGIDTALIITSNFHSSRSKSIFNKLSRGNPYFLVYPAEFTTYDQSTWWSNRSSRKIFLLESFKKIASAIEVFNINRKAPVTGSAENLLIEPQKNIPEKYLRAADGDVFFKEDKPERSSSFENRINLADTTEQNSITSGNPVPSKKIIP